MPKLRFKNNQMIQSEMHNRSRTHRLRVRKVEQYLKRIDKCFKIIRIGKRRLRPRNTSHRPDGLYREIK
jgi:hypothetical protein